jgi:hypothetical protein
MQPFWLNIRTANKCTAKGKCGKLYKVCLPCCGISYWDTCRGLTTPFSWVFHGALLFKTLLNLCKIHQWFHNFISQSIYTSLKAKAGRRCCVMDFDNRFLTKITSW